MKQLAALSLCFGLVLGACGGESIDDEACLDRAESLATGDLPTLSESMNVTAGRDPRADGEVLPPLAQALDANPEDLRRIVDEAAARTKREHGLPPTAAAELAAWMGELNQDLFEDWRLQDPDSLDAFCGFIGELG